MNAEIEVFKIHSASREKLVYFLMASAGAATGFCITLQDALQFSWPDFLVIAATGLFAGSFWAGVITSRLMQNQVYANAIYIQDIKGTSPSHVAQVRKIADKNAFIPLQKKTSKWARLQSAGLVLGALVLMAWRIARGYPEFDPVKFFGWQ